MAMESLLKANLHEFRRLKALAERALDQVDDEAFFVALGDDNSLAILVKHLAGNMRSRWRDFLTSDGEKPDRLRDAEFVVTNRDHRGALMARWEQGWTHLFTALEPLGDEDLGREVKIRGEALSVRQAVLRQLTHYAYHVGQIVMLAKHHAGSDWQSLSIPRGQSDSFNRDPKRYL